MDALLEVLGKVGFDPEVALANLVNFLLIFWVIKRFAWKPLKKVIAEREAKIAEGIAKAEEADSLHMKAEAGYKKRLDEAEEEAFAVVSEAHEQGKHVLDKAHKKAHADSESIVAMGRSQIEQEKKEMQKALSKETAEHIVTGVEKVLREKMDSAKDREFINKILNA